LIFLTLLLFTGNVIAQKIIEKSISSNSLNVVVELGVIDQVEIISTESIDIIDIIAEYEDKNSPVFIIEELKGSVLIQGIDKNLEDDLMIDKLCILQPVNTSYKIFIPKNKNVHVSYAQGNFYSENFTGKLSLKLDEGMVKLDHCKGIIDIEINAGQVICNRIEDTKIDVSSNLGSVSSDFRLSGPNQKEKQITGILGVALNELKIRSIIAHVQLSASKVN